MKKVFALFVMGVMLLLACTRQPVEQAFFAFPLKTANIGYPEADYSCTDELPFFMPSSECLIFDTLILSNGRKDYLFHLFSLNSGEPVGSFCMKGRSWNEPISAIAPSEIHSKGKNHFVDVFSFMDGKLLEWNISASLREGKDIYERIVQLDSGKFMPILSLWRLDDNHVLAFNSAQDPYEDNMESLPEYVIYNLSDGSVQQEFNVFVLPVFQESNSNYTSKNIFSCVDCMKPDRKKLMFFMNTMPVYGIIDMQKRSVNCFYMADLKGFAPEEFRWHFADAVGDDDCVYVLYSGGILYDSDGAEIPKTLFTIGWDGTVLKKYNLDRNYTNLCRDSSNLYLTNPSGTSVRIPTGRLK